MLPMSMARSTYETFMIGHTPIAGKGFSSPENALAAGKEGWECTARAKYAIYDCLVHGVIGYL